MRAFPRLLLALAVLGASPALGGAVAGARPTQEPSPQIKVLDTGSEPRDELRLAPAVGASESLAMTMRFDFEVSGVRDASVKVPPIRATIAASISDLTPEGNFRVTFSYPSFDVLKRKGVTAAERRALERELSALGGLSGGMTMTSQGAVVDSSLDIPPDVDPTVAQTISQLRDQLGVFAVALPQDEVGVGARWRATSQLEAQGIKLRQISEYRMKKRNGTTLELDLGGTQTARRQSVDVPGGGTLEVKRFKTTFRGSTTLDLTRVFPVDGRVRAIGNQTANVRAGDESGELRQHIDLRVELEQA
jgi:hypothetical protein